MASISQLEFNNTILQISLLQLRLNLVVCHRMKNTAVGKSYVKTERTFLHVAADVGTRKFGTREICNSYLEKNEPNL